jgi:hypothetical protein
MAQLAEALRAKNAETDEQSEAGEAPPEETQSDSD